MWFLSDRSRTNMRHAWTGLTKQRTNADNGRSTKRSSSCWPNGSSSDQNSTLSPRLTFTSVWDLVVSIEVSGLCTVSSMRLGETGFRLHGIERRPGGAEPLGRDPHLGFHRNGHGRDSFVFRLEDDFQFAANRRHSDVCGRRYEGSRLAFDPRKGRMKVEALIRR